VNPHRLSIFEDRRIAVTDGYSVWLVIVTCEAMKATAPPPEKTLRRLVRYAEFYRDLAATIIRRCEDVDGKVWVRESDVVAAQGARGVLGQTIQTLDRV